MVGNEKDREKMGSGVNQEDMDISWDVWMDRNEGLHNTPTAADFSGAASLDKAIEEECELGKDNLPMQVQNIFPSNVDRLLNAPLVERKSWLVMVRTAREATEETWIQDDFTGPQSQLCKWLGLKDFKKIIRYG